MQTRPRSNVPKYLSSFNSEQMKSWLNKMVMLAFTHMLLMAEVMGYDTAPMESSSRIRCMRYCGCR